MLISCKKSVTRCHPLAGLLLSSCLPPAPGWSLQDAIWSHVTCSEPFRGPCYKALQSLPLASQWLLCSSCKGHSLHELTPAKFMPSALCCRISSSGKPSLTFSHHHSPLSFTVITFFSALTLALCNSVLATK